MTFKKLVEDSFGILKKFGIKHTLIRFINFLQAKRQDWKTTYLYNRTKPKQDSIIKNIHNFKMKLNLNDYGIHRDLFIYGYREPLATKHLKEILKPDDIVLEIGANIGYYVLVETQLCKKIYAIEPIAENVQALKENLELNNCQNAEIYELALGEKNGYQDIYLSERSNLHSFYINKAGMQKRSIEVSTADNFLIGKEKPTTVRMDVEGYELAICKGMNETFKTLDKIFIEIHAHIMKLEETRELLDILKAKNFVPELIIQYDWPNFKKILPNDYINKIYQGDKGGYEIFFKKA